MKKLTELPDEVTVDWLVSPLLMKGRLTMIEGRPDTGKSWLTLLAAADVLTDGDSVAIFDDIRPGLLKKRLRWSGADDQSSVFIESSPLNVVLEQERLIKTLKRLSPALVIFDGMHNYAALNTPSQLANAMNAFSRIATETGAAVLVTRTWTNTNPRHGHAMQMVAANGAAAIVVTTCRMEDSGTFSALIVKSNLGPLGVRLEYAVIDEDEEVQVFLDWE